MFCISKDILLINIIKLKIIILGLIKFQYIFWMNIAGMSLSVSAWQDSSIVRHPAGIISSE